MMKARTFFAVAALVISWSGMSATCDSPTIDITQVQGIGFISPLKNTTPTVSGVVTLITPELNGFFIQSATATHSVMERVASSGLFVQYPASPALHVGSLVHVTGQVVEQDNTTQLHDVSAVVSCGEQAVPDYQALTLPLQDLSEAESLEGMRVKIPQSLLVSDLYQLGRNGSFAISHGRRFAPTQLFPPGPDAAALRQANMLNWLTVAPPSEQRHPATIAYPSPGLTAQHVMRVGDTVVPFTGVLSDSPNGYRIYPDKPIVIESTNPRPPAPAVNPKVQVYIGSFNVLNFFNGDGRGQGFPTPRGADSEQEFLRQRAKIIQALQALHADVVGLMEVENDGYGKFSAIAELTAALEKQTGQRWRFVVPAVGKLGNDAISVGMIYRADVVSPVGNAQILDSSNSARDEQGLPLFLDTKSRPSLAQEFVHRKTGNHFVTVVNHLKSKGSSCAALQDPNAGDGQGNCNLTRTRAAQALGIWLNKLYPDKAVLMVGDFNAYSKEDPIRTLAQAGFHSLFEMAGQSHSYSFVYKGLSGQLDHALANDKLARYLLSAKEWHINADEAPVLDYNLEYKTPEQQQALYSDGPYRSSDHDPVRIGLSFDPMR